MQFVQRSFVRFDFCFGDKILPQIVREFVIWQVATGVCMRACVRWNVVFRMQEDEMKKIMDERRREKEEEKRARLV